MRKERSQKQVLTSGGKWICHRRKMMGDLDLAEQNSCLESHLTICFAHFPPFLVAQMILVLFDSLHSPFLFQRLKCVSFFFCCYSGNIQFLKGRLYIEKIMYSSVIYVDNLEHVLCKGLYLQDSHSKAIEQCQGDCNPLSHSLQQFLCDANQSRFRECIVNKA